MKTSIKWVIGIFVFLVGVVLILKFAGFLDIFGTNDYTASYCTGDTFVSCSRIRGNSNYLVSYNANIRIDNTDGGDRRMWMDNVVAGYFSGLNGFRDRYNCQLCIGDYNYNDRFTFDPGTDAESKAIQYGLTPDTSGPYSGCTKNINQVCKISDSWVCNIGYGCYLSPGKCCMNRCSTGVSVGTRSSASDTFCGTSGDCNSGTYTWCYSPIIQPYAGQCSNPYPTGCNMYDGLPSVIFGNIYTGRTCKLSISINGESFDIYGKITQGSEPVCVITESDWPADAKQKAQAMLDQTNGMKVADWGSIVYDYNDRDGDGVSDSYDMCPDSPSTTKSGCPDADNDGVPDYKDQCPNTPANTADGCPIVCGDNKCDATENCSTCAQDCGACQAVCGNSVCEAGETCSSCPGDCGVCPPNCGNGVCGADETCSNCATDCGACNVNPSTGNILLKYWYVYAIALVLIIGGGAIWFRLKK